jgi:hypothetical protein
MSQYRLIPGQTEQVDVEKNIKGTASEQQIVCREPPDSLALIPGNDFIGGSIIVMFVIVMGIMFDHILCDVFKRVKYFLRQIIGIHPQ